MHLSFHHAIFIYRFIYFRSEFSPIQYLWMNYIIFILPMKPEGQDQRYILRLSLMFCSFGTDSPVSMWAIMEWKLGVFYPKESLWFLLLLAACPTWCTLSMLLLLCGAGEVGICDEHVCTVCVWHIGYCFQPKCRYNHWPQPTKYRDPYCKSLLFVVDPGHHCQYSFYWMDRVREIIQHKFISAVGSIRTHNS